METQTLVKSASSQASTPRIWEEPNLLAQVGDIIREPFKPVMRVIERRTLKEGRIGLLARPTNADALPEVWVLEAEKLVETQQQPQQTQPAHLDSATPQRLSPETQQAATTATATLVQCSSAGRRFNQLPVKLSQRQLNILTLSDSSSLAIQKDACTTSRALRPEKIGG